MIVSIEINNQIKRSLIQYNQMQEIHQLDLNNIKLYCPKNQKALQFCISQQCSNCALICLQQQCPCHQVDHKDCQYCRAFTILDKVTSKKKKVPSQIHKAFKAIDQIYQQAIEQLSRDREKANQECSLFGLRKNQAQFISLISQGKFSEITGKLVNQVRKDLNSLNDDFSFLNEDVVTRFWKHKKQDFEKVRQNISNLASGQKMSLLQSKITTDQFTLKQFFDKPIFQFKLLYRASQHNYSVAQFHQKCDYRKDTITLILTQGDKIIGGYTPLPWNTNNCYYSDPKQQTFIFSLSLKEKFHLKSNENAVKCGQIYGPSFGSGHDIYIANEANTNNKSYSYFPSSFNNKQNTLVKNQQTHTNFTGVAEGYNFRIKQWQVFQIQWDSQK